MRSFLFTKLHLKIFSAKRRPFCPGGNELIRLWVTMSSATMVWLCYMLMFFSRPQEPWKFQCRAMIDNANISYVLWLYSIHKGLCIKQVHNAPASVRVVYAQILSTMFLCSSDVYDKTQPFRLSCMPYTTSIGSSTGARNPCSFKPLKQWDLV